MGVDREAVRLVCSTEFWRMAVYWTLSLLYSHLYLFAVQRLAALFPSLIRSPPSYPRCRFAPSPEIERPICVITGATSGLGAAAAKNLAKEGYHVILAGRSPQLLNEIVDSIKLDTRDACLTTFQVDLCSFQSIMKFEKSIKHWLEDSKLHSSIQLLINNAGILAKSSRVTSDGFDQMLETNYIGAFVLTNLMLPLLRNSPVASRIVNVTSFTHRCVGHADFRKETLAAESRHGLWSLKNYSFGHTYEYSKLCLLLFTYQLHQQLYMMNSASSVSVMPADPGAVRTNIMRELPPFLSWLAFTVLGFLRLLSSPEEGVNAIIDAALAPPEASGKYFFGGQGRTMKSSPLSYKVKLSEELWENSIELFQELQKQDSRGTQFC